MSTLDVAARLRPGGLRAGIERNAYAPHPPGVPGGICAGGGWAERAAPEVVTALRVGLTGPGARTDQAPGGMPPQDER
jgi:hypothetical protein